MIYTESKWIPEKRLLVTRLGGNVGLQDVKRWEKSLEDAIAQIEGKSSFKAFINLYGFKATDLEAHKAMRTVVPFILARYNFKAGYIDLFEDTVLTLENRNGITCTAVAHVHNDKEKIKLYQERFNKSNERFFTNPEEGERWIESV